MYGLIIEGVLYMVREKYGMAVCDDVMAKCSLRNNVFSSHERYSERILPDLLHATCELTGDTAETVGIAAGMGCVTSLPAHS
jgi:hypothetical protein